MRKQWVVVGILAGTLLAGDALAQHKAPNQQPNTAAAPASPTGDIALGSVRHHPRRHGRRQAAPGRHLYVRVTAQEAKPEAVGTTEALERWVEFVQKGEVKGARSSRSSRPPRPRWWPRTLRRAPGLEGPDAPRQRIHARLVQQGAATTT